MPLHGKGIGRDEISSSCQVCGLPLMGLGGSAFPGPLWGVKLVLLSAVGPKSQHSAKGLVLGESGEAASSCSSRCLTTGRLLFLASKISHAWLKVPKGNTQSSSFGQKR